MTGKVLNFGSINIDHVYTVPHLVRAGETISSTGYTISAGGKGANQSVALAKAGATVYHAGKLGATDTWLLELMRKHGVITDLIVMDDCEKSGQAIIQVDDNAENCIVLYPGTNHCITEAEIENALAGFADGDILLLQNEINNLNLIMEAAAAKGMKILMNPAPVHENIKQLPLALVDTLIVNETEGEELTGSADEEEILEKLHSQYDCNVLLTLGAKGVKYFAGEDVLFQDIFPSKCVDTVAAGDTFIGYYISELLLGADVQNALRKASAASSITVSRPGAMDSIPLNDEVDMLLKK